MPTEDALKEFYGRYYENLDERRHSTDSLRYSRHLYRVLGVPAERSVRILDFGGGEDATISRSLADQFIARGTREVEITLVDYSADCPTEWGERITVHCHTTLPEPGEGFNAVIGSSIIEHIPYPPEAIRDLLCSLRPGGRAYFRTPSVAAILKLASRFGIKIDFTFPAHVHDMGQSFWENLLTSLNISGFRLIHSRPSIVETRIRCLSR